MVDAAGLLRGRVSKRTSHETGIIDEMANISDVQRGDEIGQANAESFCLHQDVVGLDPAMDDARLMHDP